MFKYLLSFVLFIFMFIPAVVGSASLSQTIKIIQVHSYDLQHPCTYPQIIGFNKKINSLDGRGYKIITKMYYMDAKTKNTSYKQQEEVSKKLIQYIKDQKPDYVFVTDDVAFEHVGIPAATLGFKVLAAGLNKQIQSYVLDKTITTQALKNLYACEEYIHLDDIFYIFEKTRFKPFKWYILHDETETSYYMMENYEKELISKGDVIPISINSVNDLEDFLDSIKDQRKSVLVLTLQSIYSKNSKTKKISKDEFIKIIFNNNTKHLELSANMLFSKFGVSISSGPDFEDMGNKCASYIIDQVIPRGWKPNVTQPITKTAVNKQRLKELKFDKIMDVNTKQIKIFDEYQNI